MGMAPLITTSVIIALIIWYQSLGNMIVTKTTIEKFDRNLTLIQDGLNLELLGKEKIAASMDDGDFSYMDKKMKFYLR